jgi:hypothetical protein
LDTFGGLSKKKTLDRNAIIYVGSIFSASISKTGERKAVLWVVALGGNMAKQSTKIVLSVRQPWAWLLVHGYKDIENRRWFTTFRGRCLIHAGKTFDRTGYEQVRNDFKHIKLPKPDAFERGGIVGWVEIIDCVTRSQSEWFAGPFGFVIGRAGTLPFFPIQGRLKFFEIDEPVYHRVDVTPPALIEHSSQKANVKVSVTSIDRRPMAGLGLSSELSPAQLGRITDLTDTDESGMSTGEWHAGRTAGEGWLVVRSQFGLGRMAIKLFTPVLQVTVRPSVLKAGSGAAASVVVRVKDADGNPLKGISLYGKTVPSSLGEVSGLPGSNGNSSASRTDEESNLQDTDVNGMSMGLWWAGSRPGRGRLVVQALDSGHRGEAAILLIAERIPPGPDGPQPGDPTDLPDPVVRPNEPVPDGPPETNPTPSKPPGSNGKGKGDDTKGPRRRGPRGEKETKGDKGDKEGEHDDGREETPAGSIGSRSPHLGTQRREPSGSKGGRPGRRGPGHKESGSGG